MLKPRPSVGLLVGLLLAGCGAGHAIRHTVTPGESVSGLAARAGVSETEFRKANHMGPSDIVRPGDTVLLSRDSRPAPPKEPERASRPAPSAEPPKPRPEPVRKPSAPPPSRAAEPTPSPRPDRSPPASPSAGSSPSTPFPQPSSPAPAPKARPPKPPVPAAPRERKNGLSWPVAGDIARGFGKNSAGENLGIDIRASVGTTVRAAGGGKVIYAGTPTQAYGPLIVVDHGGRLHTVYSNLRDLSVKRGDSVDTGHPLGTVGDKVPGAAPHLHFEVRKGGDAVDPLLYLPAH